MGTVGSFALGKMMRIGMRRKKVIAKIKRKREMWRDKARLNLIQQHIRYDKKVKLNRRLMDIRKADRPENLNPTFVSLLPKGKDKFEFTLSTIPEKPRHSDIKPRKRLYGTTFKLLASRKQRRLA